MRKFLGESSWPWGNRKQVDWTGGQIGTSVVFVIVVHAADLGQAITIVRMM